MYIDYHYYMIKALAFYAGFTKHEAKDIAYASEYIDDALEFLPMDIRNVPDVAVSLVAGGRFDVVCTAHDEQTMLGGALQSGQARTYVPFHFIPRGKTGNRFDYRTAPNTKIARDLVEIAAAEIKAAPPENRTRKLIKLGIALHTYADTWAHSDFSGLYTETDNGVANLQEFLPGNNGGHWTDVEVDKAPAIVPETGHAKAHAYPDSSHSRWRFHNSATREFFEHDNPALYMDASEKIYALLRDIAGGADRWPEIKNKVKTCIEHRPAKNLWDESGEGLSEKIKVYLKAFPEVFLKEHNAPADNIDWLEKDAIYDTLKQEHDIYNELEWKSLALIPFVREARKSFKYSLFDTRKMLFGPFYKLKWDLERDIRASIGGHSILTLPIIMISAAKMLNEALDSLKAWIEEMRETAYQVRDSSAALKWFYFHLEAEAQRQFVLKNCPDDLPGRTALPLEQELGRANLQQQIGAVVKNSVERFALKPAKTLEKKDRWSKITLRNATKFPIEWRGHYNEDFRQSHGRYWDRPDRGGSIKPGEQRTFSVCERDNAVTDVGGVTQFVVKSPDREVPFLVAFSNPLVSNPSAYNPFSTAKKNPCLVTFELDANKAFNNRLDSEGARPNTADFCDPHKIDLHASAGPGQETTVTITSYPIGASLHPFVDEANGLELFCIAQSGDLWKRRRLENASNWDEWQDFGKGLKTAKVVMGLTNHREVFLVDAEGKLYHRWFNGAAWSEWAPPQFGGVLPDRVRDVAVVRNANGALDVFLCGVDGKIYHSQGTGLAAWRPWTQFGDVSNAASVVGSGSRAGSEHLFVVTQDSQLLWARRGSNDRWQPLQSLSSSTRTISLAENDSSTVLLAIDVKGMLFSSALQPNGWSEWKHLHTAIPVKSASAAFSRGDRNLMELWIVCDDDSVWSTYSDDRGQSWQMQKPNASWASRSDLDKARNVVCASSADRKLFGVYAVKLTDGTIVHNWMWGDDQLVSQFQPLR